MWPTRPTTAPATAAAFSAKAWWSGRPAAAIRNMITTTPPQIAARPTAIPTLTVLT